VELVVTAQNGPGERTLLRFEIRDTGIGMAADVQAALFRPFMQADSSTTRKYGGTGLGLAICRRIVELMHGQLGVHSEPGKGSTFWFTADLEKSSLIAFMPEPAPASLQGRQILVVDDNATNGKLLDQLLTVWKAPHRTVDSADAAMAELRRAAAANRPYELVVLDHHMPGADGMQLAAAIRAEPTLQCPALLLLTSRGERVSPEKMVAAGFAGCELKPVYPDKFLYTLGRLLGACRLASNSPVAAAATQLPLPGEPVILAVEDNPVNQKVIRLMLSKLGYAVDVAGNGEEAIAALRRKTYALVLMDEQMPVLDGFAATRFIRQAQAAGTPGFPPGLRIIAMTANAMTGDRETSLKAGMDDYVSKPVRAEILREILVRHLPRETSRPGTDYALAK
jgi:CheY-like chemotaxis protein